METVKNIYNTPPTITPVQTSVMCAGRSYWIEETKKEDTKNLQTLEASKASAQVGKP